MPTAFVTGGTGFVGLNLVEQLCASGWRVVALHRKSSDLRLLSRFPVERAEGSIADVASLERAIPANVDAVFHVAGNTSMWSRARGQQWRDNVDGVRNMLAAARARNAQRFVQTSSIAAFGHHGEVVTESTPSNAEESWIDYIKTKRLGEKEVERAAAGGLHAVILNPAHVVGRYDTSNWARLFRLVKNREVPGMPPGRGSWAHVTEVARAHIAAAERGRRGEHYLLGGPAASFAEVFALIARILDSPPPTRVLPASVLRAVGWAKHLASYITGREPDITPQGAAIVSESNVCDSSKAERELGYRTVPLETMFRDCYEWLRGEELI